MTGRKVITILPSACAVVVCSVFSACSPSDRGYGIPDEISYNWHVRPILSENCFKCHGPDPEALEAGLRLDVGELAVARLEGPRPRFAIVPGDPDASELIRRINSGDIDERMPPQSEHKTLTDREKAILRHWIAEGAEYQRHWAFIAPERSEPPPTEFAGRVSNAIDRFVFRRLEQAGLAPSPEANRETLINRVSLTLTGLPPRLDEVDAFVADTAPDAYERLVDRLLASPRYAEHMAAYWMDLARWSESDGYLDDHHDRVLWPWRDWVIASFDRNMPYDEFGTWQLAGDLLPDATRDQILATAFLRIGERTTENGAIEEEYKAEYMIERTDNALGVAFLGLTLECARCHDHKYDPVTQRAYYSLGAFFNSNDEPGVYGAGFSGIQGGPTLPWPGASMQAELTELETRLATAEAAHARALAEARPRVASAVAALLDGPRERIASTIDAALAADLAAYYPLDAASPATRAELPPPRPPNIPPPSIMRVERNPYGNGVPQGETAEQRRRREQLLLLAGVPRNYVEAEMTLSPSGMRGVPDAVLQGPILREGVRGRALFFDETNKGFLGMDVGWYDNQDPFSFDLWFYAAQSYDDVPVINHRTEQNSGYTGYSLDIENGHLLLRLAHSPPANMIALKSAEPLPIGEWAHIAFTYDGSSRAAGTKLYLNGAPLESVVLHDTLTRTFLPWSSADVFEQFVGVAFGTRFRAKAPVGSGLDEIRVFDKALTSLEIAYLHDPQSALSAGEAELETPLAELLTTRDRAVAEQRAALIAARGARNRAASIVPQVLVMREAPEPIPTHVLDRGVYSAPAEPVEPRGLDVVLDWNDSLPPNRLGLAEWLFDERNPLTGRVFVNRMWQMHFGRGLVETAEDFGAQGAIPSHPELLDWLATQFVASGWDVKALHRLIVSSSTYRQSSDMTDALLARDARNSLLGRGPRWRMTAEMVRDSALHVAGLLRDDVGGESARPYQPPAIWNPTNSFYVYPEADAIPADEHHRRTLYTFVKRNALHPTLEVFDFPNRKESYARRRSSNTPLQALTLLNDPQYVEAYRELATSVLAAGGDLEQQLAHLYRISTRATPEPEHIAVLREYFEHEHEVYAANAAKRDDLLGVGVTAPSDAVDPTALAAMTHVAALAMNSPDAYAVH